MHICLNTYCLTANCERFEIKCQRKNNVAAFRDFWNRFKDLFCKTLLTLDDYV